MGNSLANFPPLVQCVKAKLRRGGQSNFIGFSFCEVFLFFFSILNQSPSVKVRISLICRKFELIHRETTNGWHVQTRSVQNWSIAVNEKFCKIAFVGSDLSRVVFFRINNSSESASSRRRYSVCQAVRSTSLNHCQKCNPRAHQRIRVTHLLPTNITSAQQADPT